MVRFNDKTQINKTDISSDDIMPITDISNPFDDKKISLGQISEFISDTGNVSTKNLDNTGMLTDAILQAPNGVFEASVDNTEIIIREGLDILVPNGRTVDNRLSVIEYVADNDIILSVATIPNGTYTLFLDGTGNVSYINLDNIFIARHKPEIPSSVENAYWYDVQENFWKTSSNQGSTWSNFISSEIGFFVVRDGLVANTTPNTISFLPPPEYITIRDMSNVLDTGKRAIAKYSLENVVIETLNTSGTINLSDNSINSISPTGAVTFNLPIIENNDMFHQILVQLNLTTVYSIDVGTTYFFDKVAPNLGETGMYNLIYEYDKANQQWVCGVLSKGEVV